MKKRKKLSIYFLIFIMIILTSSSLYIANSLYSGDNTVIVSRDIELKEVLPLTPDTQLSVVSTSTPTNIVNPAMHIDIPKDLRGVYVSRLGVTSEIIKNRIREMINKNQINAIVIDVKDNEGKDSFGENLKNFIEEMHSKNIYVIGRIAVFQDDKYAKENISEALQNSDGSLWSNVPGKNKSFWLDPASTSTWEYNLDIAKRAYHEFNFDEINLDYIRYPADGEVWDIVYTHSKKNSSSTNEMKRKVLEEFFIYINDNLSKENIKVSADVFGVITVSGHDNSTGQNLSDILEHFDYVSPMIYPSHFADGTFGLANPSKYPYEVIENSMKSAIEKSSSTLGTSTEKWRPWLQDFDLGAVYDESMVRRQIDALESLGIRSYLLWNSANRYHGGAMER